MVFIFSLLSFLSACTNQSANQASDPIWEKGKSLYQANCIACHNPDPNFDGAVGPALKGSSKELLQKKIVEAAYPTGYIPKRNTKAMPALPQLAKDIDALAVFLNQ